MQAVRIYEVDHLFILGSVYAQEFSTSVTCFHMFLIR